MKKRTYALIALLFPLMLFAQKDSIASKLSVSGDFRFRVEQDWDSRKSDGSFRDDRTRLRYRARFGASYQFKEWVSFGARIRTGDPKKQQDPQLTLGDEFNSLPIAFEKIYAQFKYDWFSAWLGKNNFPFEKQNELFWSDNVFPEGIAIRGKWKLDNAVVESIQLNGGHFVVNANGGGLDTDGYFEGFQLVTSHFDNRLKLYPAIYYFNDIPDIPDGNATTTLDYVIFHAGTSVEVLKKPSTSVSLDYYQNLEDYTANDSIPKILKDQKTGLVGSISVGKLKKKNDWAVQLTYVNLERYAAVDFFAQNDWARWDYSSQGSADGRLTNFKGFELSAGYNLDANMNLKLRYFNVDQLIPVGSFSETNSRVRLDFNIGF
ncbi:putative porin [Ulvibacter antarcticus]|uniref:Putative porin n=1 Tax=Ulvibacter antarcticus TaxID=442714 RepID=A0A3L9YXL9_9FLAO|nr:putative porin [Ulvibacter antarcticus]RMA64580.1 putative porin [Ulvibacter antarcticus]